MDQPTPVSATQWELIGCMDHPSLGSLLPLENCNPCHSHRINLSRLPPHSLPLHGCPKGPQKELKGWGGLLPRPALHCSTNPHHSRAQIKPVPASMMSTLKTLQLYSWVPGDVPDPQQHSWLWAGCYSFNPGMASAH